VPPAIPVIVTIKGNIVMWFPDTVTNNDNKGTATFYVVQYAVDMIDWLLDSNMIRTKEPMAELMGLVPGNKYRIRVRAGNQGGLSDWSNSVIFTAIDQQYSVPSNVTVVLAHYYICK